MLREHKPDLLILLDTRMSSLRAEEIHQMSSLSRNECVEAKGFLGGIWVLWNDDTIAVEVISKNMQVVNAVVKGSDGVEWILSAVCASPNEALRNQL